MQFYFTRSQLKLKMNANIHGRQGMLIDANETINSAVRQFNNDVDSLAARRRTVLAPNLYNGIFDYTCPADLDGFKLIDIPAQAKRQDGEFFLVPTTEFDIKRQPGMVAIDDYEGIRVLKINSKVQDHSLTAYV